MPEIRETEWYKESYQDLLPYVTTYGISKEEFPLMIKDLIYSITEHRDMKINIPDYSYIIKINGVEIFSDRYNNNYLEITCGFKPKKENVDDIAMENTFLFPKSGSARMDIDSGEIVNINISWIEDSVEWYG